MGAMPLAFALPTKWLFYIGDLETEESQLCIRICFRGSSWFDAELNQWNEGLLSQGMAQYVCLCA